MLYVYLQYRQAEVARLREELAAVKLTSQQPHDVVVKSDPNTPSPQTTNSLDNVKSPSVISKANTLSLHSGSSHHVDSAPPTPLVFKCF